MTKDLLKEVEELLTLEEKRLREELAEFSKQNPKNKDDFEAQFPSMGDKEDENAEEVNMYSTNLTLERTLEASLRDVEKALERIKTQRVKAAEQAAAAAIAAAAAAAAGIPEGY